MAGVNRKHLAAQADRCPYWLLSVTLLRKYPNWLSNYLTNRIIMWDPGTFSDDSVSYKYYLNYLDRYARSKDEFLQYDEIGDHEATSFYLKDMRRRGYKPIPILQPNGDLTLLKEKRIAIGGLVLMSKTNRKQYLNNLLNKNVTANVHLLGMIGEKWFAPFNCSITGDSTTWIPRAEWNRKKSIDEWLMLYGEQWIPFIEENLLF
jgi:hypothetical protein